MDVEANITILSLMYNKLRSELMQASDSYVTIPYVLAIPEGKQMSSIERLMKPFRYILWSCFSSLLIFCIFFTYFMRLMGKSKLIDFIYGQGNRLPFSNLLSTLFGGNVLNKLPYRNFARYILMLWILYTFVVRSAYSAELYKLLQDGRARISLSSLREVVDSNYTIYAFPAVQSVLKIATPDAITGLVDDNHSTSTLFEIISSSENQDKIALCLLEYSIRSYNQMNPNHRVDILRQPLITAPIVFYMPRHTYLKYRTSDLILRILQAGLMKRFESFYLYRDMHSGSKQREPLNLSLKLLLGLFNIYGVLLLFSVMIFLLEVASLKSYCCKKLIEFLNI